MARRAVSTGWKSALAALTTESGRLTASGSEEAPERLYHFTDCGGLIGVFERKTLWASLATALNDPSEVTYGLEVARELFRSGTVTAANFSFDSVEKLLATQAAESRAYVISFCQNLNLAGQWLHYGRSGSGVAVGFYPRKLKHTSYELFPIVYEKPAQINVIGGIVRSLDGLLGRLLTTIAPEQKERLVGAAAPIVADTLWKTFPKLKHPSFAAEHEWRLIAYETGGPVGPDDERPTGETYFRASAGRVVPYKKVVFQDFQAFEVVLGASCPMRPADLGVLVVMEEKLGTKLTVRMSDVPVRA
jgi:hypothetical protein